MRKGVTDAVDTVRVKHVSGGSSTLGFKSYDQGREKWQGTARHFIWLDEEPPEDVYDEALIRTMTVDGRMMVTFTPLKGLSAVALRFMPHLAPAPEQAAENWG
jgi:phage terminase large subunit-like protein